ncbi:hypothetical protein AVEN_10501-1 [Araneus ventricosus]|uniref:Uncharacterized protein n=1 Tax=Araneus ventricosus TaxID=182803 RepID=A0A4Y2JFK6_ARAVE|nr:hypothetical protein AVEN_10501-1 [Araneus ventricosus]
MKDFVADCDKTSHSSEPGTELAFVELESKRDSYYTRQGYTRWDRFFPLIQAEDSKGNKDPFRNVDYLDTDMHPCTTIVRQRKCTIEMLSTVQTMLSSDLNVIPHQDNLDLKKPTRKVKWLDPRRMTGEGFQWTEMWESTRRAGHIKCHHSLSEEDNFIEKELYGKLFISSLCLLGLFVAV